MMQTMTRSCPYEILVTVGLLLASSGCGQKDAAISGKVTFQGAPIPVGTIAFIGQDGKVVSGTIDKGTYSVTGVGVGSNVTVTVMSHPPSPMMHPPTGPADGGPVYPPGQYVPIPERFGDPKNSGLTCDVKAGTQTHDFALKP